MSQTNKEIIYNTIQRVFCAYNARAFAVLNNKWKKMSWQNQVQTYAAFLVMRDVAVCPERFFAPKYTQRVWDTRVRFFMLENQMGATEYNSAGMLTSNPVTELMYRVGPALKAVGIYDEYYNFCNSVLGWEYTYGVSEKNAKQSAKEYAINIAIVHNRVCKQK